MPAEGSLWRGNTTEKYGDLGLERETANHPNGDRAMVFQLTLHKDFTRDTGTWTVLKEPISTVSLPQVFLPKHGLPESVLWSGVHAGFPLRVLL